MKHAALPPLPTAQRPISIARLHGEACIDCGAVHRKLYPAGEVQVKTKGLIRCWPVVACGEHHATGGAR